MYRECTAYLGRFRPHCRPRLLLQYVYSTGIHVLDPVPLQHQALQGRAGQARRVQGGTRWAAFALCLPPTPPASPAFAARAQPQPLDVYTQAAQLEHKAQSRTVHSICDVHHRRGEQAARDLETD